MRMASSTNSTTKPDIVLNSPVGSKPVVYKWPLTYKSKGQKIDGAEEIIETIRWVAREYVEFKPAIDNLLPEQHDIKGYDAIKTLCDKYNKITDYVMKMNKGTSIALKTSQRASPGLLKHIIQQVYNYSVDEPNELNKYSPFSSETYGETSFEFMAQLIERNQFKPQEQDTFIDLGSGVGHLVLQMAATVKCKKCYGIEIADRPAGYAKKMEDRFKFWMNWHGKVYTEFEIIHGDFFDKKYVDVIRSATYIFVNNFAFKPDDDHKLKQKFLDLKDGVQILSSKPFCSPKNRVSERHLSDLGSIMQVIEIQPDQKKDTVSWTPKPLPYYLHVLDSSKLQKYYERQKRRSGKTGEKGKPSKKRKIGAKGSESGSEDSDDHTVYGPTTRKAWSEWCNASSSLTVSNRTSTDSSKTIVSSRNSSTDVEPSDELTLEENNAHSQSNTGKHVLRESELTSPSKATRNDKANKSSDTNNANQLVVDKVLISASSQPLGSQETSSSSSSSSSSTTTTTSTAQGKGNNANQTPRSCLDKKRDYAIKKNSNTTSFLQNAPASALYSISKPSDSTNGSGATKIPNIVIKVKPTVETKAVDKPTSSTSSPEPAAKKLRQRKKSTQSDDTAGSTSPAKSVASNSHKADSKPPTSKQTSTRAKKVALISSSSARATTLKSNTSTNKKSHAMSPDKNVSLDLLHAKTVESVTVNTGSLNQPAPGCENFNLKSITETPSLPKVVITDVNMFVNSFMSSNIIERVLDSIKLDFENFIKKLQQPNCKESLIRSIELERAKQRELLRVENDLKRHNKLLADRVPKAMKSHCDDLAIKNDARSVVQRLGNLLRKHQELTSQISQLETSYHLNSSQHNRQLINPPPAHSNNPGPASFSMAYRDSAPSTTLDLSLKQNA